MYRLCYADENYVYFVDGDISKLSAEGWDEAPYQYAAKPPKSCYKRTIKKVEIFQNDWLYEKKMAYQLENKDLTVMEINKKKLPWLSISYLVEAGTRKEEYPIYAGISYKNFLITLDDLGVKYQKIKD